MSPSSIHILLLSIQPIFSQDWSTTEGKLGLGLQFQHRHFQKQFTIMSVQKEHVAGSGVFGLVFKWLLRICSCEISWEKGS